MTLVQAWFALSFGIEQVYALAPLARLDLEPAALTHQRGDPPRYHRDREALASMYDLIWRANVAIPGVGHTPARGRRRAAHSLRRPGG